MVIGIVTASINLPSARSLKDKRQVIRSMKDRILGKMNVSVAEVGYQDKWQRSDMAFVTVAANTEIVESRIADISKFVRSDPRYVLLSLHTETMQHAGPDGQMSIDDLQEMEDNDGPLHI